MPIELTERQRRLIDAALILAVIALGFVVADRPRRRVLRVRRRPAAVLPRVAAVVRAAAAHPRRGVGHPADAAGGGGDHRLPRDRRPPARGRRPGVRVARHLDRAVHPGRAAVRGPAPEPARRRSRRSSPRSGSRWTSPARRRSSWRTSSRGPSQLVGPLQSLAFASIGVFGNVLLLVILSIYIADRPGGDRRVPLPAGAARLRDRGAPAPDERLASRSAGSSAASSSWASCSACSRRS